MQEILEVIDSYGIDTVVLALIINVLTGIVKIPIKHLSTKLEPIKRIKIKKSRPDDFVHRGGSFYVRYNLCSRGARVCSLCRRIWDVWRG